MLYRAARAASLGCLLGGAAATLTALTDFGAHWLWLDGLRDRGLLFFELLGIQVPTGLVLGTLLGAALGATQGLLERTATRLGGGDSARTRESLDLLQAARLTLLLAPCLIAIGFLLLTGGSMSRLPAGVLLQCLLSAVLIVGTLGMSFLGHRMHSRAQHTPHAVLRLTLLAIAVGLGLGKINQWFLPKLYEYLHGALTATAFLLFMAAGFMWLTPRLRAGPSRFLALAVAPLWIFGTLSLWVALGHLDGNQNVRVALLHPNVPNSRAVMQALAPWLIEPAQRRAMEAARNKARVARAARSHRRNAGAGPVLDDAHVLLVTIDALRPDHLGLSGYKRVTSPNLDRFAKQSVVFERTYAPAPHSSYSLCSMHTSEYLHETLDLDIPSPAATLATVLTESGYHTAAFYGDGIFHTAAERLERYERSSFGFALHDQVNYKAEELTERVLQEVDRTVARGEPSSLFWVHYFDVHEPYHSTHFGSSDIDRYDGEILHVDAALDKLIRAVRKKLSRDVIVVISADHGEEFREHGGVYHGSTLYEEQIRVPLIINAKGLPPQRVDTPVTTLDIVPTLLGLLGLSVPASMRGEDLRALALGETREHEAVFAAVTYKKMIVRWPHKLVADLRFGLFELFDLQHDPSERNNLADKRPEVLTSLRSEIYAWLDSLAPAKTIAQDALSVALDWGRLGDRRAVPPLSKLVADRSAPAQKRIEAARMLGHLADKSAALGLSRAMTDTASPLVAAEAAIALGRMFDPHAREALQRLVSTEDPDLRVRAAVSLGRLRDPLAVPALIDALWVAKGEYERQEAVRWLGRLRDPRALAPLIDLLPELRTRFLVVVAMGMLGDRRGFEPLAQVLTWDQHANVRDATVQGLGLLGDPRAIDLIVPLAAEDPTLESASEALVRLGAINTGAIGGIDVGPGVPSLHDFTGCVAGPLRHDWDYLHRTYCITRTERAALSLQVSDAVARAPTGTQLVLGIKRNDGAGPAPLRVALGEKEFSPVQVDGSWHEFRFSVPTATLHAGKLRASLISTDREARFAVDHLLLLPSTSEAVAQQAP